MKMKFTRYRIIAWVLIALCASTGVLAQTASVSVPVSIGRTSCGSGTRGVQEYNYNGTTNALTNLGAICQPNLASPGFSTSLTGDAFNPKDSSLYIVRTTYSGSTPTTYVWKYRMPGCPGSSVALTRTFANWDIAGLVFDRDGNGYWIEFIGASAPYKMGLRRVDFATGVIGALDTLSTTSSVGTFQMWNLNGDVALTPRGIMFASFDNKLFTVDYTTYNGLPADKISTTYIDTVRRPAGGSMVGLCYADGKLLASYSNCLYREINQLTGDTSIVTYSGGVVSYDLTSIVSSLGVSKTIVSALPTGTPNQYDLDYNIKIQNLGNVPLDTIQVVENLNTVFGAGNVTFQSLSYVTNPGTLFLNASFNGITNTNIFTNTTPNISRLRNYPTSMSTVVVSVKCRVSNIIPGIIYNNRAIGTARGYRNTAVRDTSTDGTDPDLNDNDKSDDGGESQPTPFIINVAPELPPCDSLNSVIYSQNFGTGTGLTATLPGTTKTQYGSYGGTVPIGTERYALTNNANNGNPARWVSLTDHTGNANGRMMVVNADNLGQKIFFDTLNVSCDRFKYSFFAWVAFLGNSAYQTFCNGVGGYKYSRLTFMVRNANTGRIITSSTTADITSNSWARHGIKWVMPAGTTRVAIEIYNSGQGGCGNDLALDDIQYGLCDVLPTVAASGLDGCLGGATTFDVSLSDTVGMTGLLTYQWQSSVSSGGPWLNIPGANSANYTINPTTALDARYYKLIVSNGSPTCQFLSNAFLLGIKNPSANPASASRDRNNICPGDVVNLRVNGGSLGTNANWRWYSGSCGGTLVGTGTTISVTPSVTTTYYVRGEGDCNNTTCQPITVTINCDIDDDDDGIPDITENNGVDVEGDHDLDGIPNWRDSGAPGFVDSNSDGVDDRYDFDLDGIINQFDRDSDNDGIPDVVESGGVDADGNGIIDNYTDTDADGLSQNVDGNNTGHLISGNGLGRLDLDGDGYPNFQDLDSDGDGIPDIREALRADTDNNARLDGAWVDPDNDGFQSAVDGDADGNGTSENSANTLLRSGADVNSDGRADSWPYKNADRDLRTNPYDLDSDNDGLGDVYEIRYGQIKISGSSQFIDSNNDGFADGAIGSMGYNSSIDGIVGSLALPNNDGDASLDVYDIDSDGDGITDNIEIMTSFQPGANYALPSGTDADNDGLDDAYDNYLASFRGNRIVPVDTDSDGTPDYLDLDTDGDSQPDIIEGNDFNFDQIANDFISPANADADGDGLDNTFDNDNANPYVTSNQMGAGGSFTGPAIYGDRSPVTRSFAFQYDRDWRFNGMILQVNFLAFTGNLNNGISQLSWSLITSAAIAKMTVERSLNGSTFEPVAILPGTNLTGRTLSFSYNDNVQAIPAARYYYRIKITGIDNRTKTTNIIMLSALKGGSAIEIAPVPARTSFNLTIRSQTAAPAIISLVDMAGKTVYRQEHRMATGVNVVSFNNVQQFGQGVYQVRVQLNGETLYARLIIE